jgi:hypothetical protein
MFAQKRDYDRTPFVIEGYNKAGRSRHMANIGRPEHRSWGNSVGYTFTLNQARKLSGDFSAISIVCIRY